MGTPEPINIFPEEMKLNELGLTRSHIKSKFPGKSDQIIKNFAKLCIIGCEYQVSRPAISYHWASEISEIIIALWEPKLKCDTNNKKSARKLLKNLIDTEINISKLPDISKLFREAITDETNTDEIDIIKRTSESILNDNKYIFAESVIAWLGTIYKILNSILDLLYPINSQEDRNKLKETITIYICEQLELEIDI